MSRRHLLLTKELKFHIVDGELNERERFHIQVI